MKAYHDFSIGRKLEDWIPEIPGKQKQPRKAFVVCSLLLLLGTFFTLSNRGLAYDSPTGIPEPTWGSFHPIEASAPSWPSGWPGSQVAGYYYVDNTHPSATDSANIYGYPSKPRTTIPEITYAAGSYVEIHGGPYADNYIYVTFNGTEENPCWFRGSSGNMPVIQGTVYLRNSTFVVMEYLDFSGGSDTGLSIAGFGNNLSVRHSQFRNKTWIGNRAGIGITPDTGKTIRDVVVYRNNFEELGTWNTEIDQDFHGIVPSLWGRDNTTEEYNVWILENTCYHISGNCVQVNAGNWTDSYKYLHHIYIGRNTAHAQRQAGFWSKQASDVIMSGNTVYENRRHGAQMGDCFGYQYRPNNLWIIFNTCYDCNFGVRQTATDNWGDPSNTSYIVGNLFYNLHPEDPASYSPTDYWRTGVAMSFWIGDMNRYVVDNTIADCYNGINAIQTGVGSFLEVWGNIISDIEASSYHITTHGNVDQDVDIKKNLFYDPSHNARFRWGGTTYTSLGSFRAATGEASGALEADPVFVDAANRNYRLQLSSPAKDAGSRHHVYDTFFNLYGIDIAKDRDGTARPQFGGWDLGAFEKGRPGAPQNLKVKGYAP